MDALLLGVLAACAVRDAVCWEWLLAHKAIVGAASIVSGMGFLEMIHRRSGPLSFAMVSFGYTLIALFYLSLLLLAVTQRGFVSRLFRFRGLTELGILAYGLYLFHIPVIGLIYGLDGKRVPATDGSRDIRTHITGWTLVVCTYAYFLALLREAHDQERPPLRISPHTSLPGHTPDGRAQNPNDCGLRGWPEGR